MDFARDVAQMLTDKLDRNLMSLKEAKAFLKDTYRVTIVGRTKDQFIREMFRYLKCPHCNHDSHLGTCTARNGGTAYPCPCIKSSL